MFEYSYVVFISIFSTHSHHSLCIYKRHPKECEIENQFVAKGINQLCMDALNRKCVVYTTHICRLFVLFLFYFLSIHQFYSFLFYDEENERVRREDGEWEFVCLFLYLFLFICYIEYSIWIISSILTNYEVYGLCNLKEV